MILGNIKNNPWTLLRVVMGLIFLSAAIFRIFNPEAARIELVNLSLPPILVWPLIILEFIGGLCLFLDYESRKAALILVLFLIFALTQALIVDYQTILRQLSSLFVFQANAVGWFLHLMFIFILISLFRRP
ncbi:MAG: DoxX family membrane protein [Patescibacteria group bacterium]